MDCFGTYFTRVQTCDVTRVQSATEWTASEHTLHMSKPNVTRVQNRNGLLRYILYTGLLNLRIPGRKKTKGK